MYGTTTSSTSVRFNISLGATAGNAIYVSCPVGSLTATTFGGPTELHGLSITTANINTLRWNTRVLSILGGEYQGSGGTEQPSLKVYYTPPTPTPTSTPTQTPTPTITQILHHCLQTPTITPTTTITPTITSTTIMVLFETIVVHQIPFIAISQGSFAASPTDGTYFIENDSNLPDGCYTFYWCNKYHMISSTNLNGTTTGPLSLGCS